MAHLISWGRFVEDILASVISISMCLFRIQGWPSWKRLFALGSKALMKHPSLKPMGQHLDASATQISSFKDSKNTPTAATLQYMIGVFCRVEVYGWIAFFVSMPFRNKKQWNHTTIDRTIQKPLRKPAPTPQENCRNCETNIKYWEETNVNDSWGKPSKEHLEESAKCSRELQNCETKNRTAVSAWHGTAVG